MKTALHTIRPEQREDVLAKLRVELARVSGLPFAYVYGAVLESDRVQDVDVGVFLDDPTGAQQMNMVDALSVTLSATVGFPVDIRVLNEAPLPFIYHVLRGRPVLCRDETFLTDSWKVLLVATLTSPHSSAMPRRTPSPHEPESGPHPGTVR